MQGTIQQFLAKIGAGSDREVLAALFQNMAAQHNTQALTSAGLVIKAGGGVLAKTNTSTTTYFLVGGRLASIAANTDMPALTGLTIAANTFNVACFFLSAAGTVSVRFGTQGATAGAVVFPDFPVGQALIGFLLITHSSTFTGNTTPLDTATTVYVSPVGAVDPTLLFS